MKMLRILLAAALALAPVASASALDRLLPAPRIKDNGDVRLSDDLKIGRFTTDRKFISQPDAVQIQGSGSTGDVSGTVATTNGLGLLRTLADKHADLPVNVNDFKNLAVNGDWTNAVQGAINAAAALGRPMGCNGVYPVSKVTVATQGFRLQGTCDLRGNASVPTSAVLEVKTGGLVVDGALSVSAEYNTLYETAFLWTANTQYSNLRGVTAGKAKTCFTIGSTALPSALMSELTIFGGFTYGCTQAAKIIGTETVVAVIGAHWSGDAFGAPSQGWAGVPYRGIISIGADVTVSGGELLMTNITNGALVEMQPLTGDSGEGTRFGAVRLRGVVAETASPLAITTNPNNLPINSSQGSRALMHFDGISGFISQNQAPFISTDASYDGEVIWSNGRVYFPGTRTQPNVSAGSLKTDVYVDDGGFGWGFRHPLSGVVGGTLHFQERLVLYATNLNGQTIAAAPAQTPLVFVNADATEARGRYAVSYNTATGIFTVPGEGLKDATVSSAMITDRPGKLYVKLNGTEVAYNFGTAFGASVTWSAPKLNAGDQVQIAFKPDDGSSAGGTIGAPAQNWFSIKARN